MPKLKSKSENVKTFECVIIGGGIIGATISSYFKSKGIDTLLIDSGKAMGGTAPSGGHLRPSWFKGMEKEDYIPAMDVLDQCWGLEEEEFQIINGEDYKLESFKRVNVDHVLEAPRMRSNVRSIESKGKHPILRLKPLDGVTRALETMRTIRAKLLIVAAGVWTLGLVPEVFKDKGFELQGKTGISFRYRTQLKTPFVEQWAPYKQVVAHNQNEEEVWIGDGTAILDKNWSASKAVVCQQRCKSFLPKKKQKYLSRQITGIRPFIKSGPVPCLCERTYPNMWVVTGAAKLGTIAAGWAALKIYKEHKRE